MKDLTLSIFLVLVAVLFRTSFHLGPNFELVTSACLMAGYFIQNPKIRIAVPLAIMLISDTLIGNGLIFIFTWSAYLVTPFIGKFVNSKFKSNKIKLVLALEGSAIASVVIFFLWTNFGVVLVSNMYPHNVEGVISSYINGLPFIKPQLFSAIITTPILFTISALIVKVSEKIQFNLAFKKNTELSELV